MASSAAREGRTVVVTGGSRGIGAEIARRFATLGDRVVIVYKSDAAAAGKIAAELGGDAVCIAVQADIPETDDVRAVAAAAVERFGGIDVLVNCAGIGPYRALGQMDAAFVRQILDANVLGPVLMVEAVLPHLRAPGGRIINIASALAFRPIPTSSVYSASKAAVVTLSHAFAKELGPRGVTVNAVAPGVIETDMTTAIIAERGAQIQAMTPLGRIGQPGDIAGIVTDGGIT